MLPSVRRPVTGRRVLGRGILVLCTLLAFPLTAARAQTSPEAESLFREGRRLLKAGDIPQACDKFEASQRIESSLGTLLNLASCREQNGQLATAWALYLQAADIAGKMPNEKKRERYARKHATELEPRLSYLTISVADASRVDGLTITRNGEPVDAAVWNQRVPVDPGTYAIRAQAPGHESWSTEIEVPVDGGKASIDVPRFQPIRDIAKGKPTPDPIVAPPPQIDTQARSTGTFTTMRKIAIGVAAVGVASIGVGTAYGLQASDLQSQSDDLCPETSCADPRGVELNDDARGKALTANILWGAGAAAVGTAVALWLIGGPDADASTDTAMFQPVVHGDRVGIAVQVGF